MCRLILKTDAYNTLKEYWTAVIANQQNGFTIDDILKYKENASQEDITAIHKVIEELGDNCLITRNKNKFYVS